MKKLILMVVMAALSLAAMAQHEEDTENGVVCRKRGIYDRNQEGRLCI